MAELIGIDEISGVVLARLRAFGDARGSFRETFRRAWFPQRDWTTLQMNCSRSQAGVVRGLHYHFQQVDYWYVAAGRIRAALFDMRPASPTYMAVHTLDMDAEAESGLYIPIGVAHGFAALSDAMLIYVVDRYFDGSDEYGVAWNDPALGIDWGVAEPIISPRDAQYGPYADVPEGIRPK